MSTWSLRWHFTNKSVTAAPYSIESYTRNLTISSHLYLPLRDAVRAPVSLGLHVSNSRPPIRLVCSHPPRHSFHANLSSLASIARRFGRLLWRTKGRLVYSLGRVIDISYTQGEVTSQNIWSRYDRHVELNGKDLSCYSNKIVSFSLRKYPCDHWLTDKAYLSARKWHTFLRVFIYKMAAKINWHRYGTKLRHCHPMWQSRSFMPTGLVKKVSCCWHFLKLNG